LRGVVREIGEARVFPPVEFECGGSVLLRIAVRTGFDTERE
jgi:hypothetical protein